MKREVVTEIVRFVAQERRWAHVYSDEEQEQLIKIGIATTDRHSLTRALQAAAAKIEGVAPQSGHQPSYD